MDYRVLGPLEVLDGEGPLPLGGAKQRALLALLVHNANRVVSRERLIDDLWGDAPPETAVTTVQVYVSRLRKLLPDATLETRPPGYLLVAEPATIDLRRFEALVAEARDAHPEHASSLLREALALWRGRPLAEFDEPFAQIEGGRLEDLRLAAIEQRVEADLALGGEADLIGELEALIAENPTRERLRAQLMLALYRCDRQAEALGAYRNARRALDELGLEPSVALKQLEKQILMHDVALDVPQREANLNLPYPVSTFVGRERELAEILEHGRDERVRLLTLTGPGGSGKTRLALEAAHQLLPNHPDGVLWVHLTSVREAGLIMPTIARLLGAKVELAVHIGKRRMLLLLDNFEQVVEAAPDLIELLLSCPNLRLIVTSRERLRTTGEMEYRVPPLDAHDAVALFCERARLEPDDDIESLCEQLDNLPLAIELAAARTNVLSPAQILERLTDRFDLFTGVRDAHSRQASLRAMMEWSHDLLDERERTLFARLSIFASCTVEAAEVVCDATVDALSSLVDKSLLRLSGERFSMLETIRQYARERLDARDDMQLVARRHAEHITALAEAAERRLMQSGGRVWEQRLEAELGDIRLALGWAREHDVDLGLRLAASLTLFWMGHNLLGEGRQWCTELLALGEDASDSARAKALHAVGVFAGISGDHAEAELLMERALVLFRKVGDRNGVARSLLNLAPSLMATGRPERARRCLEEALPIHRELGDEVGVKRAVQLLGTIASDLGDTDRGRELLGESLELARSYGDRYGECVSLHSLGDLELTAGRLDAAAAAYRAALDEAREIDSGRMACYCVAGLSAVAAAGGEEERAARLWRYVEQLETEFGFTVGGRARYEECLGPIQREPVPASSGSVLAEATEYALGG